MNLLIIIGNAVVDYHFRALLLQNDPQSIVEAYGFRLTKGEMLMLNALFTQNTMKLNNFFQALEDQIYANIEAQGLGGPQLVGAAQQGNVPAALGCTKRPCTLSLKPPKTIEKEWEAAA
jgi:hypothetical protein